MLFCLNKIAANCWFGIFLLW